MSNRLFDNKFPVEVVNDIESLSLDVKYEFNSDNKRMYSGKCGTIILDEGEIG